MKSKLVIAALADMAANEHYEECQECQASWGNDPCPVGMALESAALKTYKDYENKAGWATVYRPA